MMAKTLVLYYSATNTTKKMAEAVAQQLHADIAEIHPEQPSPVRTWTGTMTNHGQRLSNMNTGKRSRSRTTCRTFPSTKTSSLGTPFGGAFRRA